MGGGPLAGRHVLVTSGPTHEPIDPVRYIANRSSGAQGTAMAAALRDLGARVTFVTGPAAVPPPQGVDVVRVETAAEMLAAVQAALPADAAVMAAAVADWRVANAGAQKMKKDGSGKAPALEFAENPDILATVSQRRRSGRGWWWALPPRPTMWWPMRRPSGRARAVTGSWPMMCRRRPGSWAAQRMR